MSAATDAALYRARKKDTGGYVLEHRSTASQPWKAIAHPATQHDIPGAVVAHSKTVMFFTPLGQEIQQ